MRSMKPRPTLIMYERLRGALYQLPIRGYAIDAAVRDISRGADYDRIIACLATFLDDPGETVEQFDARATPDAKTEFLTRAMTAQVPPWRNPRAKPRMGRPT